MRCLARPRDAFSIEYVQSGGLSRVFSSFVDSRASCVQGGSGNRRRKTSFRSSQPERCKFPCRAPLSRRRARWSGARFVIARPISRRMTSVESRAVYVLVDSTYAMHPLSPSGHPTQVECGSVLDDLSFSQDVTFSKDAAGESTVVGQFVNESGWRVASVAFTAAGCTRTKPSPMSVLSSAVDSTLHILSTIESKAAGGEYRECAPGVQNGAAEGLYAGTPHISRGGGVLIPAMQAGRYNKC